MASNGLIEAGGMEMKYVFDTDPMRLKEFCKSYPQAEPVDDIRPSLMIQRSTPSRQLRFLVTEALLATGARRWQTLLHR